MLDYVVEVEYKAGPKERTTFGTQEDACKYARQAWSKLKKGEGVTVYWIDHRRNELHMVEYRGGVL